MRYILLCLYYATIFSIMIIRLTSFFDNHIYTYVELCMMKDSQQCNILNKMVISFGYSTKINGTQQKPIERYFYCSMYLYNAFSLSFILLTYFIPYPISLLLQPCFTLGLGILSKCLPLQLKK